MFYNFLFFGKYVSLYTHGERKNNENYHLEGRFSYENSLLRGF